MLCTMSVKTMTVTAILAVLGVAGAAKAVPTEQQLRKELFFAEQELAAVNAEIADIRREISVVVETIEALEARYAETGDLVLLGMIANATDKLQELTSQLENLEAVAEALRQRINVILRMLEDVIWSTTQPTVDPSGM